MIAIKIVSFSLLFLFWKLYFKKFIVELSQFVLRQLVVFVFLGSDFYGLLIASKFLNCSLILLIVFYGIVPQIMKVFK